MTRFFKGACYCFCAVLLFFILIPTLMYQIWNLTVFAMLFLCLAVFSYAFFYPRIPHKWRKLCNLLWLAGAVLVLGLVGVMLSAAYLNPPDETNPPQTVIVLGAKIVGDQPSLMLSRRLDAALGYLKQNPQATAVMCGGLGAEQAYTESTVMKQYLVARGIDSGRIFEESASVNTGENIAFAAEIIGQNGLDTRVVICTDGFHQLRAAIFAKRDGLAPSAISCNTPWGLVPIYYVREWVGLAKALLLGV